MDWLTPDILKPWIDLVVVYGWTLVLFCSFLYFWIKIANWYITKIMKQSSKAEIEQIRKYNIEIDAEENEKSIAKMRAVQMYLSENAEEVFKLGIDQVNVWVNHNGTRIGKFHFIYYSLIAEIMNSGVRSFAENKLTHSQLPYYVFADYENDIEKYGSTFRQAEQLTGTRAALANDFWAKSIYWVPLKGIRGNKIDGIIFFSAMRKPLKNPPEVSYIADDIRWLLLS